MNRYIAMRNPNTRFELLNEVWDITLLTIHSSHCPPRRAHRPHIHLPLCLATGQEVPSRRRERCLLLRRPPHLRLRPRRVPDGHVLGRPLRSSWQEARLAHRMSGDRDELDHGGVFLEYMVCHGWESDWRVLERQCGRYSDDGGGAGYEAGT